MDRRTMSRRVARLVAGICLLAACSSGSDTETADLETTDPLPATQPSITDVPATESPTTNAASDDEIVDGSLSDELFPDVVGAQVTATTSTTYRFDVTLSSPYDTNERYADAWRVSGADGTVFGVRELTHGHPTEQPFTRSLSGVEIPEGIEEVTIEGRDILNGWGGATLIVGLPDAPDSVEGDASPSVDEVPFTVGVGEFQNGQPIPQALTCDGVDASPTVSLTAVPEGTQSFALLVDDPDAPTDDPFVHWLLWSMPVTTREITTDQVDAIDGTNDFGETGWRGPCPPPGDGPHTYRFRLFALSEDSSGIEAGLDARAFLAEIDDLVLDEAVFTGTYER